MVSVAFAAKTKTMWLDSSANFERFSYPDSIRYYVAKCYSCCDGGTEDLDKSPVFQRKSISGYCSHC